MDRERAAHEFGTYPTPVECLEQLSTAAATLWVKRDDLTSRLYGGSKVRKLGPLLADAQSCGATRLVTLGTVGSHHVLATGVFGKLAGFSVEAIVMPRPQSPHVLQTARASIGQKVRLIPATTYREASRELARRAGEGAYPIAPGGSNLLGTQGVLAAAAELEKQVRSGLLPEPDLLVLPLGSGGTAAGLAAGLIHTQLRTRVLAVAVAEPSRVFAHKAYALAAELVEHTSRAAVAARLEVTTHYLGEGYGQPTVEGEQAAREAARCGLALDDTYTAKAFAAALDRVALGRERVVLFWNTHSSAALAPLLVDAPEEHELPAALRRLAHAPGQPRRG
ncbi:MAG TPA: pyridoxal-phosphate dependent enzyme [Polyangiaceae bacterium]|nr:pyridoxal-phosphate dependent enzyme [Polyangiaceae bacterium]